MLEVGTGSPQLGVLCLSQEGRAGCGLEEKQGFGREDAQGPEAGEPASEWAEGPGL